ncbi:cbb3-type cytochrome c oxidase subunit 3 [Limnohabitans sp. Rim8]|nr:cbb3-type cytochrome c oxidase subunit 3 [Limnohabitans sp. Rim8]
MDINTLRAWVTVLTFVVFMGIVIWACSRRNQAAFEEAAQLPFRQDD